MTKTSDKLAPNWYIQMAQCHVPAAILPLHNATPHDMHLHLMGKKGYECSATVLLASVFASVS